VLDTFDQEPLVIGPTTYTSELHIQTTRPMAIIGVTDGKFSAVGRFTVESYPAFQ
jgi:branched-chain amino acid transport system substrate-binding protein